MSQYRCSHSKLDTWSKCGEAYRFRYLERVPTATTVGMVLGRAADAAISLNLQAKIETGELLPEEQVEQEARDAVLREWAGIDQGQLDNPDAAYWSSRDRAAAAATLHAKTWGQEMEPTHVQRAVSADLYEIAELPVRWTGYIDIQEAGAVRDTKTSKRSPGQGAADHSLQLTGYALAVQAMDGEPPKEVSLDYLVVSKAATRALRLSSSRGVQDYGPLLERVRAWLSGLEAGVFVPAKADAWWCSQKWCPYWDMCRYATKGVKR